MKDALAIIGALVVVCVFFAFLSWVWSTVPNWFPKVRANRQAARFQKGIDFANNTIAGENDKDIRRRWSDPTGEMTHAHRVRYCMALLEESRYFNNRDQFDQGVESIIIPLDRELPEDEAFVERTY